MKETHPSKLPEVLQLSWRLERGNFHDATSHTPRWIYSFLYKNVYVQSVLVFKIYAKLLLGYDHFS